MILLNSLLFLLLFSGSLLAQDKKITYTQFDITLAFAKNPNSGEINRYNNEKESWFIPDGIGTKLGYGIYYKK